MKLGGYLAEVGQHSDLKLAKRQAAFCVFPSVRNLGIGHLVVIDEAP
ncbi:hypothetical protein [Nitrospirillum sp. BR 11163]|nr:hypothetical protein [Nitrospirillum sp. BR 11163]MEA1674546.1 hypothetical protein [Nitrospirillum sp. BR 11163]